MTTTDTPMRNGVDTATLFATLDAVKANPDIAKFQFRATNRWVSGTHNRSTIHGFYGAGQELTHRQASTFDADHPEVLVGADNAPTPAEHLLHALAACLTSGLANIAAARGRQPDLGRVHGRGRHRPARHPGPVRPGPQRLPADPGQLPPRGRRPGEAARGRRAVPAALGRVRRHHQRRAGEHRGDRLTAPADAPAAYSRTSMTTHRPRPTTSSSSGPGRPAPPPPCSWPGPACGSWWSTASGTAPTRSRPTPCCAAVCCSSPAGDCSTGSSPPARRRCAAACSTTATDRIDVPIKPQAGVDALYAPRRTVLDPILVDAARDAGVEVRFGVTVTGLRRDSSGRVTGVVGRDDERRAVRGRRPDHRRRRRDGLEGRPAAPAHRWNGPAAAPPPSSTATGTGFPSTTTSCSTGPGSPPASSPPTTARSACSSPRRAGGSDPRHGRAWRALRPASGRRPRPACSIRAGPGLPSGCRCSRAARLPPPGARARVGAGRRRRLLQGPDHLPRHHRRPPRRRAAGPRDHHGRRRRGRRGGRPRRLPGDQGPPVRSGCSPPPTRSPRSAGTSTRSRCCCCS